MYGDEAAVLVSQIVVLQSLIWYNLLLFLFEFNTTKEAYLTPPTETTGKYTALSSNNVYSKPYIIQGKKSIFMKWNPLSNILPQFNN